MKNLIYNLQAGNARTQAKVFLVMMVVISAVLWAMHSEGLIWVGR